MHSIRELQCLVKQGTISENEANKILGIVVDGMKGNVEYLEKHANFKRTVGRALRDPKTVAALLSPIVLAGIGLGTNVISDVLKKEKESKELRSSFNKMKNVRPEIKNIPEDKVHEAFSVLSHVSPSIAKNPYLAANFVQRQAESYGGAGFEEAATLARAEQAMSGDEPMSKEVGRALLSQGIQQTGAGIGKAVSSAVESIAEPSPEELGLRMARGEAAKYRGLQAMDLSALSKGQTPQDRARNAMREIVSRRIEAQRRGMPLMADPATPAEEAAMELSRTEAHLGRGLQPPTGRLEDIAREAKSRGMWGEIGRKMGQHEAISPGSARGERIFSPAEDEPGLKYF